MKVFYTLITIFTLVFHTVSAQDRAKIQIDVDRGPNPWNNLNVNNSAENFQFAIVTDRTGGHRPGIFLDGVQKLNLLQPEFVMSVGDLIEGYTEDTVQLNLEWKEFNGFIDSLRMPFFYVPGNHDITNKVMEDKWKSLFGRTYYHFIYQDVLFLCLNSEDNYRGAGRGTIDSEQYEYIEKVLDANTSVKWTLLFMHQPLWNQQDTKRWADVEKLLSNRKHTVFVGHNHRYTKYERNNGKYFVLATTGGGSRLRGPNLGEFDHVVWVTMTQNGPVIANLLLEGIWDENIMTSDLAEFVLPVANYFPVSVYPVFAEGKDFGSVQIPVKITNDQDKVATFELEFYNSKNLVASEVDTKGIVQPNSVENFDITLSEHQISEDLFIDPLRMAVKLSYELEGRKDLEMRQNYNLRPAFTEKIHPVQRKIEIDGDLDDWGNLDYKIDKNAYTDANPFTHSGNEDASAEFSVAYDQEYLYVAVDTRDDDYYIRENGNPLNQDATVIFLDPRPAHLANLVSPSNLFADWMVIGLSPVENAKAYQERKLPEGIKYKMQVGKYGYQMEAAIPLSYLNENQASGNWKNFRINIMINDFDQNGNHATQLSWRPVWTDEDNYMGSGTFVKE